MKGIREIKGRIKSVKNTSQITRAMQLVAASKMKKAQEAALLGRSYTLMLSEILATLPENVEENAHPLLAAREVKKRGILLITSDKGLCGALNSNIFRQLTKVEQEEGLNNDNTAYVAVGRKAKQFLARSKKNLVASFSVDDAVPYNQVRQVTEFMLKSYLDGDIDTIEVYYPRFVNTLTQEPVHIKLAPVTDLKGEMEHLREYYAKGEKIAEAAEDDREINFEPNAEAILEELPALYVKNHIYHMILEMKASEQSARMVAMKSATDNANNLVGDLTLEYNKARQAAITQEILEIAAATANN